MNDHKKTKYIYMHEIMLVDEYCVTVVTIVQSIGCFLATNIFIGKICGMPVGGGGTVV